MKKLICYVLLLCGVSAFMASAAERPKEIKQSPVGQGFNVHYDGGALVYEGKIDGKYDEEINLLYQNDLNNAYKIVGWSYEKWNGNIRATLQCVSGSRVFVRFKYFDYDYPSDNRTYYWDIPLDYTDAAGKTERVYLTIRTEQNENFGGGGCSAGFFLPFTLLLVVPLILRRGF